MENIKSKILDLGGYKPSILSRGELLFSEIILKDVNDYFDTEVPNDYKQFISDISAFTFNESVAFNTDVEIPVASDGEIPVDNFYDFSEGDTSILSAIKRLSGNLPKSILPICEGAPGDIIGINMLREKYGKIYYWHHEGYEDDNLYLIAESFNDFIANLSQERESQLPSSDVKILYESEDFLERLRESGKL